MVMKIDFKNRHKFIILSTALCCLSLAVATFTAVGNRAYAEEAESAFGLITTGENRNYFIKGASLRKPDETYGEGVKFHVVMEESVFNGLPENAVTGVKILPEYLLGENETLENTTNDTVIDKQVPKSGWFKNDQAKMELIVYVYNIPKVNYGTDLAVISYVTATPTGEETAVTEYTQQNIFALAEVAQIAKDSETDQAEKDKLKDYYTFDYTIYEEDGITAFQSGKAEYGEKLSLTDPASEDAGKTFCGWWNSDKTAKWDIEKDTVKGNLSLYPVFRSAPEIIFGSVDNYDAETDTVKGVSSISFQIPALTAKYCDGSEVSAEFIGTETSENFENVTFNNGWINAKQAGEYSLTYTVTDPYNEQLQTTKTLTVKVFENAYASWATSGIDGTWKQTLEENPTLSTTNTGIAVAALNCTPSKKYYAEVTFNNAPANGIVGMAHYVQDDSQDKNTVWRKRFLTSCFAVPTKQNRMVDLNTANSWSTGPADTISLNSGYMDQYRNFTFNNAKIKYTVIRDGGYFYSFIDDKYVACSNFEFYRNLDTIPGLFVYAADNSTVSSVLCLEGDAANEKIQSVLGIHSEKIFSGYNSYGYQCKWGDRNDINSTKFGIDDIVLNPYTEENGRSFTFNNDTRSYKTGNVSPWIYFDKDFTFSWVYKPNSTKTGVMWLNVIGWDEMNAGAVGGGTATSGHMARLGARFTGGKSPELLMDNGGGGYTACDFDDSQGIRFTLTRTLKSDHAEFTLTAASVADPTQTRTQIINYSDTKWEQPVNLILSNSAISGIYTQIEWSNNQ